MVPANSPRAGDSRISWHSLPAGKVAELFESDSERGLSGPAAAARLARHGPNRLGAGKKEPWWKEALEPLTEPLVLLLIGVGVLYALLGETRDAVTILFVIVAVASIESINESRAKRAIAALASLTSPTATVIRDGDEAEVPGAELVAGDLVAIRAGDRVPADLRLLESAALRVDESGLTGESVPVAKDARMLLAAETELGDRVNLAFSGGVVVSGKARGIAVATGPRTEIGRIAGLAETAREPRTPLQQHMRELSGRLLWIALSFSVLVPLLGVIVAGRPFQEMLLTGLSLAFATIPEELPILITIVLGIGALRLSREKAVVKRLRAAETLGSVSVIGTDKTGTLTENRMRVTILATSQGKSSPADAHWQSITRRLAEAGVIANDAGPGGEEAGYRGDPTDIAFLELAREAGISLPDVRGGLRVLAELPFDDNRRAASVAWERDGRRWIAMKGAPESVLAACGRRALAIGEESLDSGQKAQLLAEGQVMAEQGLRVIALAERRLNPAEPLDGEQIETGLTFLGFAGLEDPPRPEAPAAVAALQAAGVRVLMLTGDHPATARAIANRVGIPAERVVLGREIEALSEAQLRELVADTSVFARIAPEHKLRIVRALGERGETVAVTGDGVNDAPALREAAIGVAMGQAGTDVAREAADMVLTDDNFATVATAVREGRKLYENLHKAVRYYLAAKVALIGSSLAGVMLGLPVPFAPVQIIVMELFMDLGASTTFVAERPEEDVMARPPRDPKRPFMDGAMVFGIFAGGLSLAAAVTAAYLWTHSQGLGVGSAQTAAFAAWMVGHLALAAHMRSERQPLLRLGLFSNLPYMLWAVGALGLTAAGVTVPILRDALHLVDLPLEVWLVAILAGLLAPAWWEVVKTYGRQVQDGKEGSGTRTE